MVKTIFPQSAILQKYIECFYVFDREAPAHFSYLAFPHYHTGLSFFKGVNIIRKEYQVDIMESPGAGVLIEVLGKYLYPVRVQYSGSIQEISVIFKPFGIGRFFRDHYQSIAARFSQSLDHPAWIQFGESLFNANDQMAQLEEFLLSEYKEDDEITRLDGSLPLLHDLHNNYSVMDIADKLDYNVKTFQRHFAKHMACSPVEYRRIVKFRNSIESKLSADEVKSLTGICYDSNYFDQSHFIKEFKKLTHRNPKEFFKVVKQVDGEKIVWEIV